MRVKNFLQITKNTKFSQKNGEVEICPTFAKPASGGPKLHSQNTFSLFEFWGFCEEEIGFQ